MQQKTERRAWRIALLTLMMLCAGTAYKAKTQGDKMESRIAQLNAQHAASIEVLDSVRQEIVTLQEKKTLRVNIMRRGKKIYTAMHKF